VRRPVGRSLGVGFVVCAVLWLLAARVHASGFATISFLPEHFSPVTTTPAATLTNPAALRAGRGLRFLLDGNIAFRRARYVRTVSDVPEPPGAAGANTGRAELSNVFALPTLSVAYGINDWTLGAGVFIPFGGAATWGKNSAFAGDKTYVGAVDSSARWHTISGLWATGYVSTAVAYEIRPLGLSLGASGNYVYTQLELTQAYSASLDDDLRAEGRMNTQLTGSTGSFGLGLQWEALRDRLWTGLSYQAPPGFWQGQELKGPLRTSGPSGVGKDTIHLRQDFPDIVQVGARYRPDSRFELRATGNWQRFSAVRSMCLMRGTRECKTDDRGRTDLDDYKTGPQPFVNIPRRWHDAFGARIGASAFLRENWEVFTSVSWDGTAVPQSTLEPGLVDGHDLALSLGSRLSFNDRVSVGASYMQQIMIPRDTTGKSRLSADSLPDRLPSAQGRYRQTVGILNLNLLLSFGDD